MDVPGLSLIQDLNQVNLWWRGHRQIRRDLQDETSGQSSPVSCFIHWPSICPVGQATNRVERIMSSYDVPS